MEVTTDILEVLRVDPDAAQAVPTILKGFQTLLWTNQFIPKDATFRSLESTGDLRLVQPDTLAQNMLNLYRYVYGSLDLNNTDVTKYRDNFFLPYVVERFSWRQAFQPRRFGPPALPDEIDQFYNHIFYLQISLRSTVGAYDRSILQVERLLANLDAVLAE